MKLKTLCLLVLTAVLTACGHGFEGEYTEQVGSSVEFLDAFAKVAGTDGKIIVIGPDYIDTDGIRTQYKDIFVRDSGSERYLVLKKDSDTEEAWKIVDDDTLVQGGGLVSITLKRIKKQD